LERCLRTLADQEGVRVTPFVVENGSRDGSLDLLERLGVAHLGLQENVGFARAVNLGVAAGGDTRCVLVLNADCFPEPDCVRLLLAAIRADPQLGGVQPRIVQEALGEPTRVYSAGQCLTRGGAAFERGWGQLDGAAFDSGGDVFGVSGAACLLRRELFTDLGGYDDAYFAFYEDVDLNARARLAGWRFAYVPEARAVHVGHSAWRRQPDAQLFNVELTVRNRLATAVKVLPARGVLGAVLLTTRSLLASPFRGTQRAAFAGALAALPWLPRLLRERRRLRSGSVELLEASLSSARAQGPDPGAP
jgi:GT2 family glycosyltransferase